ncbi:BamA/TamA family outer membrane protein [Parasediminibacterium sp. JCM 36343]|uniref:translocation and assembly module lipoprotein TamL n=1 Tax=Parasediminibacterium sp. JCM 36343 TaxID=3374279 RepID=UPI0039794012
MSKPTTYIANIKWTMPFCKNARSKYALQVMVIPLVLAMLASSCSVRKRLPAGETLYNGTKITVTKDSTGFKLNTKSMKSQMKKIAVPQKNKMLLGWPYKVWAWYKIGEPKRQKGLKHWLSEKFGEAPVFGSTVQTKLNVENMKGYLENEGYYRSNASGSTSVKGYKLTALYKVIVAHPYTINTIDWKIDSSKLLNSILATLKDKTVLIPGERITLDKIKSERSRIDLLLKNKGYYYFNADYLVAYVDTTTLHSVKATSQADSVRLARIPDATKSTPGNYKATIYMSLKAGTPEKVKRTYTINSIVVFPNYTLLKPPPDTSRADLKETDHIYIRDTLYKFKPFVFTKAITYRPGSLYSLTEQNKTLNRFINLGVFKFVKNRYEPAVRSDTPNSLNVYYYLTPQKKKTIQAEIGGFSKSNSYTGGQFNVNWLNRNVFSGAEALNVKTYVSYESASIDSLKNNNNYHIGTEISLTFPRFYVPVKWKDDYLFPPHTKVTLGYEWFRRQQLYTKNFVRLQYEIDWKTKINVEHTIAPISITYTGTSALAPQYLAQIGNDRVLKLSTLPEIVSGSFYSFRTSTTYPDATNIFYFNANVEAAGNIAGGVTGAKNPYSKTVAGGYFAEYGKIDLDFRYSRKLAPNYYWANRILIGASMPYGNSRFLPFSRQFIIGGSSSLRGFSPRNIGPGSTLTTAFQQLYYPQVGGDYKLEMNTEFRFPVIAPRLKSAVFLDAGNIWTRDSILYSPTGQLTKSFLKQLAVDAGVGLRFDISILIIRFDIAFPLAKPWLPEGQRWVLSKVDLGNSAWRSSNLVFNFGIGYPF